MNKKYQLSVILIIGALLISSVSILTLTENNEFNDRLQCSNENPTLDRDTVWQSLSEGELLTEPAQPTPTTTEKEPDTFSTNISDNDKDMTQDEPIAVIEGSWEHSRNIFFGEGISYDGSNSQGDIVSYEWDVNGETITGESIETQYFDMMEDENTGEQLIHSGEIHDVIGYQTTTLTVTDENGNTDTHTHTVGLANRGVHMMGVGLQIGDSTGHLGDSNALDRQEANINVIEYTGCDVEWDFTEYIRHWENSNPNFTIEEYEWEFEDGISGTEETTDFMWDEEEQYTKIDDTYVTEQTITVTATGSYGQTETAEIPVRVEVPPQE